MHQSHVNRFKHKADFRVKYRFRSAKEGGRKTGAPHQGIRSDFSIQGEEENTMYMIWPEFEDETGDVLLHNDRPVPNSGTARMWVINSGNRPSLIDKIRIGTKGNFREGSIFSADCEIIEILDLQLNPILNQ